MLNYHVIYDSERGALSLQYNIKAKTATFQFSPAINPVKASQIKKGMKIYDYDNSYFFSLSLPESLIVLKMLTSNCGKEVSVGSIKCRSEDNNTKIVTVSHFPQKKEERTKENMIITELTIVSGVNKPTGATVSYKRIVNKKQEILIPIRVPLADFLVIKSFLEKHQDFILTAHTMYLMKRFFDRNSKNYENNISATLPEKEFEDLEEYTIEIPDEVNEFGEASEFDNFDGNNSSENKDFF